MTAPLRAPDRVARTSAQFLTIQKKTNMQTNIRQTSAQLALAFLFLVLLLASLALTGCSGYRSAVKTSLVSSYQPTIYLLCQAPGTNSSSVALAPPLAPDARNPGPSLTADARFSGPVILCAEQINLMIFGGSAASNSVLSDLKIPLPGAL